MLEQICFISLALLIWFKTDAMPEYAKLFGLAHIAKVNEYEKVGAESYPLFLVEYYNCFFTRLISCPICTAFWLATLASFFSSIWCVPILTVFGLALYLILVKLLEWQT